MNNTDKSRAFRERKHEQDEAEVRGLWAPRSLHESVKDAARKVIKKAERERKDTR